MTSKTIRTHTKDGWEVLRDIDIPTSFIEAEKMFGRSRMWQMAVKRYILEESVKLRLQYQDKLHGE